MGKIKPFSKIIGLLGLLVGAFVFAMFQGGFISWFLLYSFLPFSIYSLALFFYPIHEFTVQRTVNRTECRVGEDIEVELKISRNSKFPVLFMLVEEKLLGKIGEISTQREQIMIFPMFKRRFTFRYKLRHLPRGEHVLHHISVKTGDLLGLIIKEARYEIPQTILVFPSYYDLSYNQFENFFDIGEAGSVRKLQRESSVVTGVRDYQAGDQMSWINWKATAKTNELMTKEFEEQKNHDLFVILDENHSDIYEDMVMFAASLVHTLLKKGIQIGYQGTAMQDRSLPVSGGDTQRKKIFYRLAKTETTELGSLEVNRSVLPINVALIIVTSEITRKLIQHISVNKINQSVTIFCLKQGQKLTVEELQARQTANTRGIKVNYVDRSFMDAGLLEVIAQ